MKQRTAILTACAISVTLLLGVMAAASAQTPPPPTTPSSLPPAPKPITKTVATGDNFFKPKKLTITVGSTVKWKNTGRSLHNVVPNKGKAFGVARLSPGKSYKYTFTSPGKFKYYCSFHGAPNTGQHGTIIVNG
jgi:plastocyanin